MINEEHLPALQGMFPSWITTSSSEGEPNTTVISQIWYVNATEVALSFQFFNKTKNNISQNPFAYATILNPENFDMFNLEYTKPAKANKYSPTAHYEAMD